MDRRRISRDELHMSMAMLMSQRGTCERLQVGAILVRDKRVIATSYNGPPENLPHCSDSVCDITKPCTHAIHAEANIIAFCAKHGIETYHSMMFLTHSPCIKCSELIIQSGVACVIFSTQFRETSGLELLVRAGILLFTLDSAFKRIPWEIPNEKCL